MFKRTWLLHAKTASRATRRVHVRFSGQNYAQPYYVMRN